MLRYVFIALCMLVAPAALAKLPASPEFLLTPPPNEAVTRLAARFLYKCSRPGTTLVVNKTQSILTWAPAVGVFADGDWSCYVDAMYDATATEPVRYVPTNTVTFTVKAPVVLQPYQLQITQLEDPLFGEVADRI